MNIEVKHYKTTLTAAVTAFFGFVLVEPELFDAVPWLAAVAKYAAAGGLVAFGVVSADKKPTEGE